jgi:DNA modification methylase
MSDPTEPNYSSKTLEQILIKDLHANPRNARTHSRKQIKQLADSIERFGFNSPVLIDAQNAILCGHGRVAAAKQLGLKTVPCLRIEHLTAAEKRAFILADNKIALNAGWDEQLLAEELQELNSLDLGFSLELTGFSIAEVDGLIEGLAPEEARNPAEDVIPDPVVRAVRYKPGDLCQLGVHRLICGDARDPQIVAALMGGQKAQMIFTDPPYNVEIAGNVSGHGTIKHENFAMASGELSPEEYTSFLASVFQLLVKHSVDGSIHFICLDWRHLQEAFAAANGVYTELKNLITWVKDNGGMGSFYRSRHEMILAYKSGTAAHINSFELGQHGRYRTNVWEYKGVNSRKVGRLDEIELHPTVKPVDMIADAIKDVSWRDGIVLDVFGGSGSTLIAAHKTGRRGYLCEIDPVYCETIIRRWEAFAKDEANLIACGIPDHHPAYSQYAPAPAERQISTPPSSTGEV